MLSRLFSLFKESTQSFHGQEQGEEVILLLRCHSFTIITPICLIIVLGLLPFALWMTVLHSYRGISAELFWFGTSLWYLMLWAFLFYFTTLYALNTVILTDRRLIDNVQEGFFKRRVSELNTYRVQDVTTNINGVIETFLNFGDIVVQTAASEREFVFRNIANPEEIKDKIMKVVIAHQSKVGLS
jgi:uncharacterized membrane protein YdbT with pleckstrin-like domain